METPDFFHYSAQFTPEKRQPPAVADSKSGGAGDHFIVEDLLDFPNDDGGMLADGSFDASAAALVGGGGASTDSSSATALDSSSFSGSTLDPQFAAPEFSACRNFTDGPFSGEFLVPYEDMAELEWLSNFVEESFSSEDLEKLQLISGMKARPEESSDPHRFQPEPNPALGTTTTTTFRPEMAVPAKARSKRSRAAPCNWTSRLLVVSPSGNNTTLTTTTTNTTAISSSSESDITSSSGKKTGKAVGPKKKEAAALMPSGMASNNSEGRKCLHCATDKTPQWRTGPMGPKTLCNACGVRYKSGRLVPEYRPAASPTFVLTKHSNSHRKVLEIRRQKEVVQAQQQQQFIHQKMMFDVSNGDDYLIHQHIGPHFRHLI